MFEGEGVRGIEIGMRWGKKKAELMHPTVSHRHRMQKAQLMLVGNESFTD